MGRTVPSRRPSGPGAPVIDPRLSECRVIGFPFIGFPVVEFRLIGFPVAEGRPIEFRGDRFRVDH